ncbi:1,4-dihydroxy-2-naphthoate octaprenyltransferase [Porphyromonas macacae]|uniref:1,4-dihydroxy-2-naphthoate octaprenyltransferase n=1 Tax=Porphyromonas macacae TaxID=28115 RepID=UPI0024AD94D9|nr:1,4-dihydroxy-2-naphthoate octaprenyltransferase [Porphyromonas macacae]
MIKKKLQVQWRLMRVHTLPASVAPVLLTLVYAFLFYPRFSILNAVLCAAVALSAQICSNYANDLIDYKKGCDTSDRKGFERPLSNGSVSVAEVKYGLYFWLTAMLLSGLWLVFNTHWTLLFVGLAVALGVFAYSGGPFPLSSNGLGDVAVLIFYGLVPMLFTFYAVTRILPDGTLWKMAFAMGFASVNILVVNNYRDYEEDMKTGKRTVIVKFGKDFAPKLYMMCGMLSVILFYPLFNMPSLLLVMLYVTLFFLPVYKNLVRYEGRALNRVLAMTGRNVLILSLVGIAMLLIKYRHWY